MRIVEIGLARLEWLAAEEQAHWGKYRGMRRAYAAVARSGSPISCRNDRISRYDWSILVS
jgi:hypothetical protein